VPCHSDLGPGDLRVRGILRISSISAVSPDSVNASNCPTGDAQAAQARTPGEDREGGPDNLHHADLSCDSRPMFRARRMALFYLRSPLQAAIIHNMKTARFASRAAQTLACNLRVAQECPRWKPMCPRASR
jgi:hypothetical protein